MSNYPLANICPFATWRPGPAWKVWFSPDNLLLAVCMHSAEGSWGGLQTQLDSSVSGVSWHFSVLKTGAIYQHYSLIANPWHAGSEYQYRRLIGIEHEGVKGEPLTDAQRAASVRLVKWISEQCGWVPSDGTDGNRRTVYFHSDATQTTCPNGRINLKDYMPPVVTGREVYATALDALLEAREAINRAIDLM